MKFFAFALVVCLTITGSSGLLSSYVDGDIAKIGNEAVEYLKSISARLDGDSTLIVGMVSNMRSPFE